MAPSIVLLVCFCAVAQLSTACCPERERAEAKKAGGGDAQPTSAPQISSDYERDPCATPKNVDTFNKAFYAAVDRCALLTGIFEGMKNLTHDEYHAAAFTTSTMFRSQQNFQAPTEDADLATVGIVVNCKPITPSLIKAYYSNMAGKMLNENGKLNGQNAAKLGREYATITKNVAKTIYGEKCPRSKTQSIHLGYLYFMRDQGIFEPDTITPSSTVSNNEMICQDIDVGTVQRNCPIANFSPAKPLLKESDDVCNIRSKAIDIFVTTFRNQVRRCKTLTNIFNLGPDVRPDEVSRITYYASLYLLGQNGIAQPRGLADFISRFIRDVRPIKPDQLIGVHARFAAKFLDSLKRLNTSNAKSQAIKMAEGMKKRAEVLGDDRWPTSKIVAIQLGWRYFLDTDRLLNEKTAPTMAYLYGNEWRCEARTRRSY